MPPGTHSQKNTSFNDILGSKDTLKICPRHYWKPARLLKTYRRSPGCDDLSTLEECSIARSRQTSGAVLFFILSFSFHLPRLVTAELTGVNSFIKRFFWMAHEVIGPEKKLRYIASDFQTFVVMPQGSVLSPLLINILVKVMCLNCVSKSFESADDNTLLATSGTPSDNLRSIKRDINELATRV